MIATDPLNLVRPAAWMMTRVNAPRLDGLRRRIAEAEARSNVLAAKAIALTLADADADEFERQLWDALDALQRLRFDQWVLMYALG